MALAGGHPDVPFYHQGLTLHCWLTSLEMLMSYRHGCKYGRHYQKEIGGPVVWGELRDQHTTYTRAKRGFRGLRFERGALVTGSRCVDHAVDYGLRALNELKREKTLAGWQQALSESPILAEGRFGLARLGAAPRAVLLVGWTRAGKIAYHDTFLGNRFMKYATCSVAELQERTRSPRPCFWRSL
jgi:hypothetical protein